MLEDLEVIHSALLEAYKAILKLSGVDLDTMTDVALPKRHLPI